MVLKGFSPFSVVPTAHRSHELAQAPSRPRRNLVQARSPSHRTSLVFSTPVSALLDSRSHSGQNAEIAANGVESYLAHPVPFGTNDGKNVNTFSPRPNQATVVTTGAGFLCLASYCAAKRHADAITEVHTAQLIYRSVPEASRLQIS